MGKAKGQVTPKVIWEPVRLRILPVASLTVSRDTFRWAATPMYSTASTVA